jgi:hypothetical protein
MLAPSLSSFSRRGLCVHQALSPGAFEKESFLISKAMHIDFLLLVDVGAGVHRFGRLRLMLLSLPFSCLQAVFLFGNAIRAEPTIQFYCYGSGNAMISPFFQRGGRESVYIVNGG